MELGAGDWVVVVLTVALFIALAWPVKSPSTPQEAAGQQNERLWYWTWHRVKRERPDLGARARLKATDEEYQRLMAHRAAERQR